MGIPHGEPCSEVQCLLALLISEEWVHLKLTTALDSILVTTLHGHHQWSVPTVRRWVQIEATIR